MIDLNERGLRTPGPEGAVTKFQKSHDVFVIDIGAGDLIRRKEVNVISSEIAEMNSDSVIFKDGSKSNFDAVILATGLSPSMKFIDLIGYNKTGSINAFLSDEIVKKVLTANGVIDSGKESPQEGLFFVGYNDSAGRFREISLEAFRIAATIKNRLQETKKLQ